MRILTLVLLILPIPSLAQPLHARGRVLVQFKEGADVLQRTRALDGVRSRGIVKLGKLRVHLVALPMDEDEVDAVVRLRSDPAVSFAEVDALARGESVPNDPLYSTQWYLSSVNAPSAWDLLATVTNSPPTVAVLDSGCDPTHPDLIAKYVAGWNFVDGNSNTADVQGHGTAVAGCVGAVGNNGIGIASVSWSCNLMPVRIAFNNGGSAYAYWSTVATGMQWAVDNGARIENCSYVGLAGSSTITSAAQYVHDHGGMFVACAGNDNVDPGFAANQNIIIASGTDSANNRASFSDYGQFVTVCAPATPIETTQNGGTYGQWQGTSFSSPMVAGVLADCLQAQPGLTPDQLWSIVTSTATDLGAVGWDPYFGYGLVNTTTAVQTALNTPTPPPPPVDTTPPVCTIISPTDGSAVGRKFGVTVTATDNVGVTSVTLAVDGGQVKTDTSAPWVFTLVTRKWSAGPHVLSATAKDAAGNVSVASTITVYK